MKIANDPNRKLSPEIGSYGILMSDLRGFTAISEQYPTLSILPLLNHYFQEMTKIIDSYGGSVDKFMGDSVLALFKMDLDEDTSYNMISCAIDMQLAMDDINKLSSSLNLPEVFMGIGLNAGKVVVCELGSDLYRELTVLGEPVNVVSRMSAFALRGQVLISEEVFRSCKDQVETGADFNLLLKGKRQIIKIYELQGLLYPDRKTIVVVQ